MEQGKISAPGLKPRIYGEQNQCGAGYFFQSIMAGSIGIPCR